MKFDNLLQLIQTVSDSDLTSFKYEDEGAKISIHKGGVTRVLNTPKQKRETVNMTDIATAVSQADDILDRENVEREAAGNIIKSPLVGTFYSAPGEGAETFVKIGDTVKTGQTLAIVEAMKLMNEIESDFDGIVTEVFVENGQSVEYGQPLFSIS
ncbi:acetyl-CoA carboxylase biotin carboxyl carrier protein [Lachnospiraceae bacterium LCP25S3_G4]